MKKVSDIIMIIMCIFLFSGVAFADATQDFSKIYKEIEILTTNMFKGVSVAFTGKAVDSDKLITLADNILVKTKMLEKTAEAVNNKDSAAEARHMSFYMIKIKTVIITGEHADELTMFLSKYYLHFIHCNILEIMNIKLMQNDYFGKLKEALVKNEITEIEYLAEYLCIYSDQMYYASYIFGKKIWQKFFSRIYMKRKKKSGKNFLNGSK